MADESFFDTISNTASDIKNAFNTLMNGVSPAAIRSPDAHAGIAFLRHYDIGRTAYFMVKIPTGTNFQAGGTQFSGNYETAYFCHSAELPGESTATVSQKIYGVTEKFAVMTGYNDITLSFYTMGSSEESIRKTFLQWLAYITGRNEILNYSGKAMTETTYNVRYKSDYVKDIVITHYAITGEPLTEVTLYDAFPIAINQVPLNWAAQNQAMSLNVTFAYTEYSYKFTKVETTGKYSAGPLGELIGTAIQTASTINTITGAFGSGNPIAATSTLPNLGLSNFTISSGLLR